MTAAQIINTEPRYTKRYRIAQAIHKANVIDTKRKMMLQEDWGDREVSLPSSKWRLRESKKSFYNPFRLLINLLP